MFHGLGYTHSIFLFFLQILVYDLYVHKSIPENDRNVSYHDDSQVYTL
jgi:hypothetical protein